MPNKSAVRHFLSEEKRTYTDRMAAHRKSDRGAAMIFARADFVNVL